MTEYTDHDMLKDRIASFVPPCIDESNQAYVDGLTDAYTLICQAPIADVVERKTGTWSKEMHPDMKYRQFRCSVCKKFSGHNSGGWIWRPNFCPNCGAQMIGGDDDV